MTKLDGYLRRYKGHYKVTRADDGVWQIETKHKPRNSLTFDIYVYDDAHLAAMLPPRAAKHLLRSTPGLCEVHQDGADAVVLIFREERLDELSDDLRIRRRRKVSDTERERLAEMSRRFSPLREAPGRKQSISGSEKTAQVRTIYSAEGIDIGKDEQRIMG